MDAKDARISDLEDRVTIDDALIGTFRDRIRELEAEIDRLKGEPLTAAATAYWSGKVAALRAENERLRGERDRAVESRENANAVSVRVEAENERLRAVLDQLVNGKEAQTLMAAEYAQWAYKFAQVALLAPASDEKGETDAGAL